jgi:hypothetical protein
MGEYRSQRIKKLRISRFNHHITKGTIKFGFFFISIIIKVKKKISNYH